MKIAGISVWKVPLTSHDAYFMAGNKTCDTVDSIVLRVTTDSGIEGWGEVCPIPHYLPAYADGVIPVISELQPVLLGARLSAPEALMAQLDAHLQDHRYAKSALDIAFWDIFGKSVDLPLYALLGGLRQRQIRVYHSITCTGPQLMARMAQQAFEGGVRQFQAKLGVGNDWLEDVERLEAVRTAVGPGPLVYGDWNCGSSQLDAIRVGRAVRHLDIMLEQPCRSIEECAAVRSLTGLPMKMDECVHDFASAMKAHRLGAMDVVALKLSKFGGISAARHARDIFAGLGTKMCVECTWGSDIVTSAALHLAASTDPRFVLNVCDLSGYVTPRLDPNAPTRNDGYLGVGDQPGLGVRPDVEVLGDPIATYG